MNNMDKIYGMQKMLIRKFKKVPEEGKMVRLYDGNGNEYKVRKGVFWPSQDSEPLLESLRFVSDKKCLDVCTGAGHIAIKMADKLARYVVALDINPDAIKCVEENAERHHVRFGYNPVCPRVSDVFSALGESEKFDIITFNPPFVDHSANDFAEMAVWDPGLSLHKRFFASVDRHLEEKGRVYVCQAGFGALEEMLKLADEAGLKQICSYWLKTTIAKETEFRQEAEFWCFEFFRKRDLKQDF
jgi:methylase of polypeptide subunit release factors